MTISITIEDYKNSWSDQPCIKAELRFDGGGRRVIFPIFEDISDRSRTIKLALADLFEGMSKEFGVERANAMIAEAGIKDD